MSNPVQLLYDHINIYNIHFRIQNTTGVGHKRKRGQNHDVHVKCRRVRVGYESVLSISKKFSEQKFL